LDTPRTALPRFRTVARELDATTVTRDRPDFERQGASVQTY
jgi:hypothetical protein